MTETTNSVTRFRDMDAATRITAFDKRLYELGLEQLVTRGGAKGSKPNPEWREFVKKWKVFEGAREDGEENLSTTMAALTPIKLGRS